MVVADRALSSVHASGVQARQIGEAELGPHDADDGERLAVERKLPAEDARNGAEAARPKALAEHDDPMLSAAVFVRPEGAAQDRLDPEHVEESGRDRRRLGGLRGGSPLMLNDRKRIRAMRSKVRLWACQSKKFAGDTAKRVMPGNPSAGGTCQTNVSQSGSGYGSGRSSTALTTLKMAVLAPMPSARTRIAAIAKPGRLRRTRTAYRRSRPRVSRAGRPRRSRYRSLVGSMPPSFKHRLPARFLLRQAAPYAIVHVQLDVAVELGVEVAVAALRPEEPAQAKQPGAKPSHDCSFSDRNRSMMAVVCCQLRAAFSSCFRPARVSR